MDVQDLKIYLMNVMALAVSFTQIEMMLKIILLVTSIGYTAQKWYEMHKNKKK
jgi:hypothetical protein